MGLDPAAVTSRSNTELCNVEAILNDVTISPPARMALILAISCDWHEATQDSTGRFGAEREAARRKPLLWRVTAKRRAIAPASAKKP